MKNKVKIETHNKSLPVYVERDERGMYAAECPLFSGCYAQGPSLKKALVNIKEVIELCLEEAENFQRLKDFDPETSFHVIPVAIS
jgi:predicted RNase H-like HicB family nuclease